MVPPMVVYLNASSISRSIAALQNSSFCWLQVRTLDINLLRIPFVITVIVHSRRRLHSLHLQDKGKPTCKSVKNSVHSILVLLLGQMYTLHSEVVPIVVNFFVARL